MGRVNLNRRLQALARQSCAAFVGTNGCRYAPNGQPRCVWFRDDPQARPFLDDNSLRCFYMEKHVLPADPALQAAYWSTDEISGNNCKTCGVPFVRRSNRQAYCSGCAADRKRARSREGMKRGREQVRD